jgi:HEAT repeat protein
MGKNDLRASKPRPTGGSPAPQNAAPPNPYTDPLRTSEFRERTIQILTSLAVSDVPAVRANALEGLSHAGERVEPLIPVALADPNEGVRAVAAMIVGRLKLASLVPAVEPLRNDPSPFVRAAAVYALVRTGAETDPTPLAQLLFSDPSYRVRSQVVFILGELGNPSAAAMIGQAAEAPSQARVIDPQERLFQLQVAEALVKLGARERQEVIKAALYPSSPEALEAAALAAQIAGQLEDHSVVGDLINLVEYKDQQGNQMPAEVRLAAAAALARLGQPYGTYIADEHRASERPALRAQAAAVYGELRLPENLPKLEAMLADPSPLVRVSAASAILRATGTIPER